MLELLVAFTLYRLEANWIWWVLYLIILIGKHYEKDFTE